jgi:hypothetical protein
MKKEQDVRHEQQEERDVRDSKRDKRESHGRSKRLFRGGGEGISPVPARPFGSGNETEGARMTISSDLKLEQKNLDLLINAQLFNMAVITERGLILMNLNP